MIRGAVAVLVVLLSATLVGCLDGDVPSDPEPLETNEQVDLHIPSLMPGTTASYLITGHFNTGMRGAGVWLGEGEEQLLPAEEPLLVHVEVGSWAHGYNPDGTPGGPLLPVEYRPDGYPPKGADYLSTAGGSVWVVDGAGQGEDDRVWQIQYASTSEGRPDMFMGALFGGVHVTGSTVATPVYAANDFLGFNEYADDPWVWNVTPTDAGVRLELDLRTYHSYPISLAIAEFDATCPFPGYLRVHHPDWIGVFEANRTACSLGEGRPARITGPDERNFRPGHAYVSRPGELPTGWLGYVQGEFELDAALGALARDEGFQTDCSGCVLVGIAHDFATTRPTFPPLLAQTETLDQWFFTLTDGTNAVNYTLSRSRESREITVEFSSGLGGKELPDGVAYGIDLGKVRSFVGKMYGEHDHEMHWNAMGADWRTETIDHIPLLTFQERRGSNEFVRVTFPNVIWDAGGHSNVGSFWHDSWPFLV